MREVELRDLEQKAADLRIHILDMVYHMKSGHLGGSLSIVEILVTLYGRVLRTNPADPHWAGRDRFILSKGHCAPALYAVLSQKGFFPADWLLDSFRGINTRLQGHPDMNKTPGVDMTTGSLGIGLSVGCGMAFGARMQEADSRVYVLLGDGELNEGQVWEAAKTAAHLRLSNLVALVDVNGYQNDGATKTEMNMESLAQKWAAFGWYVCKVDGHDIAALSICLDTVSGEGPSVLLCRTKKGKGVSFMEVDPVLYHSKCPDEPLYRQAREQLMRRV